MEILDIIYPYLMKADRKRPWGWIINQAQTGECTSPPITGNDSLEKKKQSRGLALGR